MEKRFLTFVYTPYEKIDMKPELTLTIEDTMSYIHQVMRRRELLYIDVFMITHELHTSRFDNQVSDGQVKKLFEKWEKE